MRERWNELKVQILHPNPTWTCQTMLEENKEEMREWKRGNVDDTWKVKIKE